MSKIFEVKRSKIFYEYNGCQYEDVGDILSFKGIITCPDYERHIIGFFNYKENCYYWFGEDFDEFHLNKLNELNWYVNSLNELEEAINEDIHVGTFKLTHVAHDYSLFIQKK